MKAPWSKGFACKSTLFKKHCITPQILRQAKLNKASNTWHSWQIIGPGALRNSDETIIYPQMDISFISVHTEPFTKESGWHLSSMHGRFKKLNKLKSNSFSHAEYSDSERFDCFDIDPYSILLERTIKPEELKDQISKSAPSFLLESKDLRIFL